MSSSFQGFVLDDNDEGTSRSILQQIFNIDTLISQTRFDKMKSNEQIINEISSLLNQRNELYINLMKKRSDELHGFVNSLDLNLIQMHPFYPVPTRCKFIVQNEQVQEAVDTIPEPSTNPWQKLLSTFMNKSETIKHKKVKSQLSELEMEHLKIVEERKAYLTQQMQNFSSKKHLSPMDYAEKCRIESELADIEIGDNKNQ
ncbi:hypothetical protein M9Y10_020122 [Tritrichomonas musculus]|uniref:Uncharacterized protein n=1 Tax=Tritrichomonas musculus TaxID=1915356 RepID=A0ABR2HHB0_9EUKA